MDLSLAGSETQQYATQSVICHLATAPESLAQARNEFEYYLEDHLYKNAELKERSKREILDELVTIDALYDLSYLSQVI